MIKTTKSRGTRILVAITLLMCLWAIGTWIYRYLGSYDDAASWMSYHKWMILALVLLNIGDILTTEVALRQSKGKGELNPVANAMFQKKFGKIELYLVKLALIAFVVLLLSVNQDPKALLFITVSFGLVVLNNLRSILMWLIAPEFSKITRSAKTSYRVYLVRISEVFLIAAFCVYGIPYLL